MGNQESAIVEERRKCPIPDVSISECERILETGDLLLSHASGPFSRVVESSTSSPWSHVGMIVKHPQFGGGKALIWETTRRVERVDVVKNEAIAGATLSSLRTKLETYDGNYIAFRKLFAPEDVRKKINDSIGDIIRRFDGSGFDSNQFHFAVSLGLGKILPAILLTPLENPPCTHNGYPGAVFCSQMIALTYSSLGILDCSGVGPYKVAMEYIPKDFSSCSDTPIKLLGGCKLGPEFFAHLTHLGSQVMKTTSGDRLSNSSSHDAELKFY